MNKEASIQIAMEFIKKWERLGSKSRSGGSYSPERDLLPSLSHFFMNSMAICIEMGKTW
jgi:hypothetical protein